MEIAALMLLLAGGLLSGAVTAIAGGGSFLTFPMLLAALAMAGETSIHKANAKKNLMVVALSIAGLIVFLPTGVVVWPYALPILIASGIGGYGAAFLVRRLPQHVLRLAVLSWAIVLTAVMFWKYS